MTTSGSCGASGTAQLPRVPCATRPIHLRASRRQLTDGAGLFVLRRGWDELEFGSWSSIEALSMGPRLQAWRPEARVVKTAMPSAYLIDDPMVLGAPPTVMLASEDDREAEETVARMLADIGLDPWDAGPLRMSRANEALGVLCWVPLLQGREQGIELQLLRSRVWPCSWDVQAQFGTPPDAQDLARLPVPAPPRPCAF